MCVCVYVVVGFGLGPYMYIYIPWGPSQQLNKWPFRKKEKKENTPLGSDFKSETIPGDYYFNGL